MNSPTTPKKLSPVYWFILLLILILGLSAIGPAEKTLGMRARVVYLHGVWVWTALAGFVAAAVCGVASFNFEKSLP